MELIKESVVFVDKSLRYLGVRDQGSSYKQMTHRQALLTPRSREYTTGCLDYPLDIIQDLFDPHWFFYFLLADAAYEFFRVSRDTSVRK